MHAHTPRYMTVTVVASARHEQRHCYVPKACESSSTAGATHRRLIGMQTGTRVTTDGFALAALEGRPPGSRPGCEWCWHAVVLRVADVVPLLGKMAPSVIAAID